MTGRINLDDTSNCPVSGGTAVRLVAQRCGRLRITLDDIAAELEAGDR